MASLNGVVAVHTGLLAARDAAEEKPKAGQGADPYAELLEAYGRSVSARFSGAQSADEVAAVIVEAATAEAPHLRYQTSDYARGVAAQVRRDPPSYPPMIGSTFYHLDIVLVVVGSWVWVALMSINLRA